MQLCGKLDSRSLEMASRIARALAAASSEMASLISHTLAAASCSASTFAVLGGARLGGLVIATRRRRGSCGIDCAAASSTDGTAPTLSAAAEFVAAELVAATVAAKSS